jgi:hypothetical protein
LVFWAAKVARNGKVDGKNGKKRQGGWQKRQEVAREVAKMAWFWVVAEVSRRVWWLV